MNVGRRWIWREEWKGGREWMSAWENRYLTAIDRKIERGGREKCTVHGDITRKVNRRRGDSKG